MPEVILNSKSENTFKTYNSYFKAWCVFCNKHGFVSVPANPAHIAIYLTSFNDHSISSSKINAIVYSISWAHRINGNSDPCKSNLVIQTKEGVLRNISKPKISKSPFSTEHIKQIVALYGTDDNLLNCRFVVMCLLSFAGFLRFDEVINIKMTDIKLSDQQLNILIRRSKTDQFKLGSEVVIAATGKFTCPVKHLLKYIKLANLKEPLMNTFLGK